MKKATKLALGTLAMLMLASPAAFAQSEQALASCYQAPAPYGPPECAQLRQTPAFESFRYQNAAVLPGFITDPATGQPISSQAYQAKYPWTDKNTWQYDSATNLWHDLTGQQ